MRLSTRSTYGVRAMLALALREQTGPVMIRTIADDQNLPVPYLEQLLSQLRKANLVTTVRGPRGGYSLARPATAISVADVIEALEGPITLTECPSGPGCCGDPESCAVSDVWAEATESLLGSLSRNTLASLAERTRAKAAASTLNYSI